MARSFTSFRPGLAILALLIAVFMWSVATGTSSVETVFEVPIELHGIKDNLVVTDQNADAISLRVKGSRAALRNVQRDKLKYVIDVAAARPGESEYDVQDSRFALPGGAEIVSRSPSTIQIDLERRGRKAVNVRPDVAGEPGQGFHVESVTVEPHRVWLTGARSRVQRLSEVVTETVDIAGLEQTETREVKVVPGAGSVTVEENKPVRVTIRIEPDAVPEAEPELPEPSAEGAQEESVPG